ncbi:MAG: AMP-binding protein [Acidobacteriota bacterium]
MSLSNLYNYAPSKDDLLVQILRHANEAHLSHTEWAVTGVGNAPADRLLAGVRAYVEYVVSHPAEVLVAHTEFRYLGAEHRRRLVVARDHVDDLFQGIVAEGVALGVFTTPHPREVTRAILTMCAGVAEWYRRDGALSGEEIAERYGQLSLLMVRPAPAAAASRTASATVYAQLVAAAEATSASSAIVDASQVGGHRAIDHGELVRRSERTAAFLTSIGVRRGDSVAILLPNCLMWLQVLFAAARLGALLVPLNTRYRAGEITHLLALTRAGVLVTADTFEGVDFATRLHEVAQGAGGAQAPVMHVVCVAGDTSRLPSTWTRHDAAAVLHHELPLAPDQARADDPLIVFGTSGTTSAPKLAVHTHRTVLAQMRAVAVRLGLGPDSRQLAVLALSGTFGFVPFISGLLVGGSGTLLPTFEPTRVVDLLSSGTIDLLVAAEGSVRDLLDGLTRDEIGRLRRIVTAGLAIDDILDAAEQLGILAMNVYGSSEVFAFAGMASTGADRDTRALAGGLVTCDGVDVRVVDGEGHVLPLGEVGELQFQGSTVFQHYLHNPEATAASRTSDGWFHTGDSGRLVADRTFQFLARLTDTLRLGGYSTSPAEVETTIQSMPGVRRAQLVGVRDAHSGDDLGVAFVMADSNAAITEEEVIAHCKRALASFKVPKRVVMVDAYPITPSANGDKVRRDELRARAATHLTGSRAKPARTV